MCLRLPTTSKLVYKVYKLITAHKSGAKTLESVYQSTLYERVRPGKEFVSDRKTITPTNEELENRTIDNGLHVFLHEADALDFAKNRGSGRFIVVELRAYDHHLVATGEWDSVQSAVYHRLTYTKPIAAFSVGKKIRF